MTNASLLFLVTVTGLTLGCANRPASHHWFSSGTNQSQAIEEIIRNHPIPPGQNIFVTDLGQTGSTSHHIVQIRGEEPLHIHRTHDLTAQIYQGEGTMMVGTARYDCQAGDVVFVPMGVPHKFINRGKVPAAAFVVFSPALVGKDFEPVESK